MPRLVPAAFAILVAAAVPASAQQSDRPAPAPRDTVSLQTATDSAVKDIERAVSALAASIQEIVTQTANKPEVRLAAVQVAGRAVSLAQHALTQNTSEIERLLSEASRLLEKAERAQRERTPASARP